MKPFRHWKSKPSEVWMELASGQSRDGANGQPLGAEAMARPDFYENFSRGIVAFFREGGKLDELKALIKAHPTLPSESPHLHHLQQFLPWDRP